MQPEKCRSIVDEDVHGQRLGNENLGAGQAQALHTVAEALFRTVSVHLGDLVS